MRVSDYIYWFRFRFSCDQGGFSSKEPTRKFFDGNVGNSFLAGEA
jgi:hypothetical protein